ncbi:UPF0755 protein [Frondihabitans sp. PhB188]|uniref:endolytic transglycosylase MltG n=1 Tax=Frondihabitans sp. PhB188 TaxID=2485200 RepID=UPI000F985F52|nr:endolytic transglycosylase MltG [Frondihabitans sp. PhB188]ROQ41049.1 UPF0755 protein [Frondihabitans sp. PhB188]
MADEPSWDEIFTGSVRTDESGKPNGSGMPGAAADRGEDARRDPRAPGAQGGSATGSGSGGGSAVPAPPMSRRQLREQREEEERRRGRSAKPARPARVEAKAVGAAPAAAASEAAPATAASKAQRTKPTRPPRVSRWRKPGTWILIGVLVVVLGGGTYGVTTLYKQLQPMVASLVGGKPSDDYTGSGDGTKVEFTIVSGDIGSTIASKLAKAGITKSAEAPYKLLLADTEISFQPGTYSMFKKMSAQSAIDRLQSDKARITTKLVIPEGTSLNGIIGLIASATKIPSAKIKAAAADYKSFGLPSNARSLEGYLFPATYELEPNKTAHAYLQDMVDTMETHLTDAGVPKSKWEHTIIFASLIQREAGLAADFPKVARVFQNRIDQGMLLQSDATVAYGAGSTDRVTTTDAERADASNKYNTYVHKGLPVGPISNPGDIAIQAAVKPATGSWLYFVTVNLDTGETVFSNTYAEHQQAVAKFQSWLRAHPDYQ